VFKKKRTEFNQVEQFHQNVPTLLATAKWHFHFN